MVIVELIVRCPACGSPGKRWAVAAFSGSYMTAWSDGWVSPPLEPPPVLRCARCGHDAWRDDFAVQGQLVYADVHCRLDVLDAGASPVAVMRVVRELSGRSLAETKEFMARLPAAVLDDVPVHIADSARQQLERAGARVEVTRTAEGGSSPEWFDAPDLAEGDSEQFLDAHALSREQERTLRLHLVHVWNHPYREDGAVWVPVSAREPAQVRNARRLAELLDEPLSLDAPLAIIAVSANP